MSENYSRRNAIFAMATIGGVVATGGALIESSQATAQTSTTYYPPGNILNFGADPTGTNDSYSAFAAAIAALWNSDNGCAIYVPTGKYKINQPIIFKTKMKLYGDGFSSVIKCNFGVGTTIPNVAGAMPGASLSLAPMICNTSPIMWWSIQDIQFDGLSKNVYGAWFASAYYGTIKNVHFMAIGGRPYTALVSNFINHSHVAFYECGDSVICWNCLSFSMDTVAFEACTGNYSFQWRSNAGYGTLDMRNIYLENTLARYNTIGFIGLGGHSIFGRSFLASNKLQNSTLRLIHLFDDNDTVFIDGLSLSTMAPHGIDLGQISDLNPMYYYFGSGAVGNSISGYIHLAYILKNPASTSIIYQDIGSSSNGVLAHPLPAPNGSQPNFVTSLT